MCGFEIGVIFGRKIERSKGVCSAMQKKKGGSSFFIGNTLEFICTPTVPYFKYKSTYPYKQASVSNYDLDEYYDGI